MHVSRPPTVSVYKHYRSNYLHMSLCHINLSPNFLSSPLQQLATLFTSYCQRSESHLLICLCLLCFSWAILGQSKRWHFFSYNSGSDSSGNMRNFTIFLMFAWDRDHGLQREHYLKHSRATEVEAVIYFFILFWNLGSKVKLSSFQWCKKTTVCLHWDRQQLRHTNTGVDICAGLKRCVNHGGKEDQPRRLRCCLFSGLCFFHFRCALWTK